MPSARLTLKVCVGGILFKVFYAKIMHHKYSKAIKTANNSQKGRISICPSQTCASISIVVLVLLKEKSKILMQFL